MFFMFLNFKTMPQMAGIERDVEVARLKFRSHCRERPYTRCRPFGLISSAVSSRTQRTHRAQRNVRKQLAVLATRALRLAGNGPLHHWHPVLLERMSANTIRDAFNVSLKADMSQLNLP